MQADCTAPVHSAHASCDVTEAETALANLILPFSALAVPGRAAPQPSNLCTDLCDTLRLPDYSSSRPLR